MLERLYPEVKFGGYTDIDGTIAFFLRASVLIDDGSVVLDVGCGRGEYSEDTVAIRASLRNQKGRAAHVIGIDMDSAGERNPCIDEFRLIDTGAWPVEDHSIDVIICDHVLEHVDDPEFLFAEFARVLKPGGHLCARTPNKWSYVALAARLIPNKHHAAVTGYVQANRQEEDVFPTRYLCNTQRTIGKLLTRYGFDGIAYTYEAEPSYLSFSSFLYFLGYLHQKLAPPIFSPVLFVFAKKLNSDVQAA